MMLHLWRLSPLEEGLREDVFLHIMQNKVSCHRNVPFAHKTGKNNAICVYCGSTNHISKKCHKRPNDNREEPRSTPMDLGECGTGNSNPGFQDNIR